MMDRDKPKEAREANLLEILEFSKKSFRKDNFVGLLDSLRFNYLRFAYFDFYLNRDIKSFKSDVSKSAQINKFLYNYYSEHMVHMGGILYFDIAAAFLSDDRRIIQDLMEFSYEDYIKSYLPAKFIIKTIKMLEVKDYDQANEHIEAFEAHVKKKDKSMAGVAGVLSAILNNDLNSVDENIEKSIKLLTHRQPFSSLKVIDFETLAISKVASYFGYETRVDHPLVPKDLIPFKPLDEYDTIDFLKDKETFETFVFRPWYKKIF
jgi:hypothetical protein